MEMTEDLTHLKQVQLNRRFVKGFTTDIGGRTSHSAIMAHSMEFRLPFSSTPFTSSGVSMLAASTKR